jgi:tetratricopeptide (TPR) repeat protein
VAWIAELKNTLSGVLGLAAVYAYLGFDEVRERRRYALAMLLFVLALAAKTVTAMLPVMLLAAVWWRRGALSWRRDVLPIAPFLLVGGAAGLTTAFVERTMIGASGAVYDLTVIERCLVAGRAFWFYLATLAWPSHLVFIYPRWQVSQEAWWQYLYPIAALALVAAAWAARRRTRGPLAAILAYSAALVPALGFFNVYPFRYSFVADHFAYLAAIPVCALIAAGVAKIRLRQRWRQITAVSMAALLLAALGTLTFRESHEYANATVLYETTLRDNPSCWLAHVNLGITLADTTGNLEAAVRHFKAALLIEPHLQEGHLNLGLAYEKMGRLPDAIASYEQALGEGPDVPETHVNLCHALATVGRLSEARAACERAVAVAPDSAGAQFGLGTTLRRLGDLAPALDALTRAARLAPRQAEIYAEMGITLQGLGRMDEAAAAYQRALQFGPRSAESLASLGFVLSQQGRASEAMRLNEEAIRLDPRYAAARYYLGCALQSQGRVQEAIEQYRQALAIDPSDAATHNNLGLALEELGQRGEAAGHYREALRLRPDLAQARDNLARVSGGRAPRVPRSPIPDRVK